MSSASPSFSLESVAWDDERANRLRRAMNTEMNARYGGRTDYPETAESLALVAAALAVDPADLVVSILAVDADGTPLGHAALRMLRGEWEVKRVIVADGQRGRGIGRALMDRLEGIAREAGAPRLILQTGDRQPDAVALYERLGYTPIPAYEPYATAIPFSLCYEKALGA